MGKANTAKVEMRVHGLAPVLVGVYRLLGCPRRRRLGAMVLDVIQRLEGGPCFSKTARRLLADHHGVEVGDFSYGPCMVPGVFPRGVKIGRYVSVGPGVRVFPRNHPLGGFSTHPFFYEPEYGVVGVDATPEGTLVVGNDVWIGGGAIVTPGCREIGDGAVIGAGAVVTRDVPAYAVVVGNPAKVIRYRLEGAVAQSVSASQWWKLTPEMARKCGECAVDEVRVPFTAKLPVSA